MVAFKNRYMVMEVLFDRSRDFGKDAEDPVVISKYNIESAIKDSIRANFGECGLASSLRSLQVKYVNKLTKVCIVRASRDEYQKVWCSITLVRSIANYPVVFNLLDLSGSIRACKNAALKCEEVKFEHYKLLAGARCTPQNNVEMQKCLDTIKNLES
uniref:Uncharacterized protein n=1 Tax=Kalanchoe fedtschenkoi TaxID=63787 RepID=A0A7N0SW24_KALFE